MNRIFYEAATSLPEKVCEEEAQVWFEHQQQLHGEGQQAFAWRLNPGVNNGRLVHALTQALRQLSGADRLYIYDDKLGLIRHPTPEAPEVAFSPVRHEQQAIDALLKAKDSPVDLARTTPLQFKLFIGEQGCILGMIIHDILLVSVTLPNILQTVRSLYQGDECPASQQSVIYERLSPPSADRLLTCCGAMSEHYLGGQTSGVHLRATLSVKAPSDDLSAFIMWSATLALTLSEMTKHAPVTLFFAGDRLSPGKRASLTLACENKLGAELAQQIERYLQNDEPLFTAADTGVPLLIEWNSASFPEWSLGDEVCQPLHLPPGYTAWPLRAIFSPRSQIEIIVGAQLAGWVGEYLLYKSLQSPAAAITQQWILAAFREAQASPEMGENDDFFEYGGHSLIATRIIGRLKSQHRIEININDLFSYPTAAQLAAWARAEESYPVVSTDENRYANYLQAPLSLAQKSLWKIYKALSFCEAFNIPFALRFLDPVNEELFRQAFTDILVRHAGLRSVFVDIAGEIYQQIIPPEMLSLYEWFWFSDDQQAAPLDTALKRAADYHFELDNELPIRVTFLRDQNNGQQVVSLLFHHIVLDEWSVNTLKKELAQAMASRSAGTAPVWQHYPAPFHAFALQQSEAGLNERHLRFWLDRLRGVTPAPPVFAASTEQRAPSDAHGGWIEFRVERAVSQGLYQLAKQQGASLFNVVYSGIAAALHLLGGMRELVIGTSASGRNNAQFFDTIGYFTTVVVHRIIFDEVPTLNALIQEVKRQINDSMPYTDIPVDLVEEALFSDSLPLGSHMFEVFIQIHAKNKLNGAFRLADGREVRFRQVDPEKTESVHGLQFEVMEEQVAGESDVRVMMSYRGDHYTPAQIEQITQTTLQMFTVMAASVGGPDVKIDSLRA